MSSEKFPGSRFTFNKKYSPQSLEGASELCRYTNSALLFRELQWQVEYLTGPNAMYMEPGQSSSFKCSQVGWKAPAWGALSGQSSICEKVMPTSGSHSLTMRGTATTQSTGRATTKLAATKQASTCCTVLRWKKNKTSINTILSAI